jgi:hypothetical protein
MWIRPGSGSWGWPTATPGEGQTAVGRLRVMSDGM